MSESDTTQMTLEADSDATISGSNIAGQIDQSDVEDADLLGRGFWTCTGEMVVQADWLQEKFDEHGVSRRYLPDTPTPRRVYRRAIKYLVFPGVYKEAWNNGLKYELDTKGGEDTAVHLQVDIYTPEEQGGGSDGQWETFDLGTIKHDEPNDRPVFEAPSSGHRSRYMASLWGNSIKRMKTLYDELTNAYIDTDLRKVFSKIKSEGRAIKLRSAGVITFLPEASADTLEGIAATWADFNHAPRSKARKISKHGGFSCEVVTLPVFDTKSNLVQMRVQEQIDKEVDDALENAFDKLDDDTDETAAEIVDGVLDALGNADDLANTYNDILSARLSVKRIIRDHLEDIDDDDRRQIAIRALDEKEDVPADKVDVEPDDDDGFNFPGGSQ